MDGARFDTLIRSLCHDMTRRGLTRLLGGLAVSGLSRPWASAAKKRGNRKKDGQAKGKHGKDRTGRASATQPAIFNPPKKSYLALGDSLAFGFQFGIFNQHFPDVPPELFERGYVDDLSHMLHPIRPDMQTVNYGCPGETSNSFIQGGCFYTAQGFALHDSYSGSQLDAAITFLRAHRGQVSPITLNLGANDLNALQALCGSDVACYELQGPIVVEQIRKNLDAILGALRAAAPNSEILTFTQYSVGFLVDPRFLLLTNAFNDVVVTTAAAYRVRVADVFAAFNGPPQPETICNLTLVCTAGDSHPSDAGYQVIAEQLWLASDYAKLAP
jgi:lysophospholipase L1-like esterase